MKKIVLILLITVIALSSIGCANETAAEETLKIEGSLEEIMASLYEGLDIESPKAVTTVVTEENVVYFLGTGDVEYVEALASEPMISSIAHSVVLVRVAEDADVDQIKSLIKDNVDGRKWICVGVEEENILVENVGDLILLAMDDNSAEYVANFLALAK